MSYSNSTGKTQMSVREYYQRLQQAEFRSVVMHLLPDRVTEDSGNVLRVDCPRHASKSKQSLQVDVGRGLWFCHGCQEGGGVLHLVEFVQSGQVTKGQRGIMPASHREARDWLANQLGLPLLGGRGLSAENQEAAEEQQHFEHRVFLCLTRLSQLYHEKLLGFPEGLTWLKKQYGFDREVVEKCGLGFCEDGQPLAALRREGFLQEEILGTGAFTPGNGGGSASTLKSHLAGRVTFPYLRGNQVVYMAGRCTPWTFRKTQEPPKFKKLWVHHPEKSPWVAPCVNNGWLFNEEVLAPKSIKTLVITEGFADCLALEARGIPSLSPATVKFKPKDLARIAPRLREMEKVVLCLDQEFSRVGLSNALEVALHLRREGVKALVLELPLENEQQAAWDRLSQEYGLKPGTVRKKTQEAADEKVLEDLETVAKQDVASYFLHGHGREEFLKLLEGARHPVEWLVEELPAQISLDQGKEILFPLVQKILGLPPVEQAHFEEPLKAACKRRGIGGNTLRAIFQEVRKEKKAVFGSVSCSDKGSMSQFNEQANMLHVGESQKEAPILEMGNTTYFLRGAEIWKMVRKEKKDKVDVHEWRLTNFHLVLDEEQVLDEGEAWEDGASMSWKRLMGRVIWAGGKRDFFINSREWYSNQELLAAIAAASSDLAVCYQNCIEDIRLVAQALSEGRPTVHVSTFFGLHPSGEFRSPTLIIRKGEILPTGKADVEVAADGNYPKTKLLDLAPVEGDSLQLVLKHVLGELLCLHDEEFMLPLLAHVFVGPMLFGTRLKRSFRPYVLFLTGPSGIGKSECARLLQNFYGDYCTLDDLANWGSTPEYCRQEAARGRGNLWVIDDFKRGKIGDLHWTNALRVLMDYADGQGRHRATPGSKVKTGLPLHCALLVPGEDLPSNETAVLARSLVLEFKGCRNPDLFERCQEWEECYRQIPGPFIAWLQGRDEKALCEQARRRKKFWLDFLEKKVGGVDNAPRLCGAVALNQTSLSEFLTFVCEVGGLTKREAESLACRHEKVLGNLLCTMSLRVQETRPAEVVITHLRELILTGQAVIATARRTALESRPENVVGFFSSCGQFVRLIPGPAMSLFRETYRKTHGIPFSYSNHAVGRQLLEAGLLMGDGAKQTVKKTRYPVGFSRQGTFNAWVIEASLLMPEKELRVAKGN